MTKILIVEDNEALRKLFREMLQEFEVLEACNGEEGVNIYKKHKPDIVIMDILMPEMDGMIATREILKFDPKAKIAALTAYSSYTNKMLEAGALEVMNKPIAKEKLIQKIEEHLS